MTRTHALTLAIYITYRIFYHTSQSTRRTKNKRPLGHPGHPGRPGRPHNLLHHDYEKPLKIYYWLIMIYVSRVEEYA